VALAGVDHQKAGGARGFEHRLAGRDRGGKQRHVIAERFPKAARLEEIALHVDDDERGAREVERHRLGLSSDGCLQARLREESKERSNFEAKRRRRANRRIQHGF